MNPSRIFILRPVATTMLMVGITAGGCGGVYAATRFGVAGGGLSDHSGHHVLSRRQPGRDGVFGDRAARTPVRTGARVSSR